MEQYSYRRVLLAVFRLLLALALVHISQTLRMEPSSTERQNMKLTADEKLARRCKHMSLWSLSFIVLPFCLALQSFLRPSPQSTVFLLGSLGLPLLWLANLCYFRHSMYEDRRTSKTLKFWLHSSMSGLFLISIGFAAWIVYFQVTWQSWDKSYFVYQVPQNHTGNSTMISRSWTANTKIEADGCNSRYLDGMKLNKQACI